MSRLKRLKEEKDKIKVTACGLALTLAIGSAQGLGTYALFTDIENVPSDLSISTGDVDVELDSNSSNINSDFNTERTYEKKFTITNNGTLRQNIQLNLNMILGTGLTDEDWISSYSIKFENSNIKSISNLNSLYGQYQYLMYDNTNDLFVLNPGETINAIISIKTKNKNLTEDQKEQLANKTFDLRLNVKAIQIGHENINGDGFYDMEVRTDKFTIAPMIFGITFSDDDTRPEDIKINFSNFIDTPKNVSLIKQSGQFITDLISCEVKGNTIYIEADIYNTPKKEWYINDKFTNEHYIIFKFEYENETRYFKFEFKIGENSTNNKPTVDVKIEEVNKSETILSEVGVLKLLNDEVDIPIEPEVIEKPKVEEDTSILIESEEIKQSEVEKESVAPSELEEIEQLETEEISTQIDVTVQKKNKQK